MNSLSPIPFDNTYANLPEPFYSRVEPIPVSAPALIKVNADLAQSLQIDVDYLTSPAGIEVLSGNRIPDTSEPIAMAYAGHQFGNFVPQLGDGRAILLGEVRNRDGERFDIHLKGSGRTPYSRNGDGRAWLGPVLREYVVSEAMAAMNIPTTRALAAVTTGEAVVREEILPGAILTRIAKGHVRVGTFEYFASRGDHQSVRTLADYAIERFYPDCRDADQPYLALFEHVLERQARLVAQWMGVGFIHGVMNTDNMSISGETIDYGPCAFMDGYHPGQVFSYIDQMGRYAYANQPYIAKWNLSRLASTLVPLLHAHDAKAIDIAQTALDTFETKHETEWTHVFNAKLGLERTKPGDATLAQALLTEMAKNKADFTLVFRGLMSGVKDTTNPAFVKIRDMFKDVQAFDVWLARWHARLGEEGRLSCDIQETMRTANPAFIPRNHRIEQMIEAARNGNFSLFEELHTVLIRPFEDQPQFQDYQIPPKPDEVVHTTFCGT